MNITIFKIISSLSIKFVIFPLSFILCPIWPELNSKSMSLFAEPFALVDATILKFKEWPNFFLFTRWSRLILLLRRRRDLHFICVIIPARILDLLWFILYFYEFCYFLDIYVLFFTLDACLNFHAIVTFINTALTVFKTDFAFSDWIPSAAVLIVSHLNQIKN